jgi:acetyl-CoA C-acetyltransferase
MHDREGPSFAILFGRLEDGRRFIANTPDDPGLLADLEKSDALGLHGHVNTNSDGIAIFTPG